MNQNLCEGRNINQNSDGSGQRVHRIHVEKSFRNLVNPHQIWFGLGKFGKDLYVCIVKFLNTFPHKKFDKLSQSKFDKKNSNFFSKKKI